MSKVYDFSKTHKKAFTISGINEDFDRLFKTIIKRFPNRVKHEEITDLKKKEQTPLEMLEDMVAEATAVPRFEDDTRRLVTDVPNDYIGEEESTMIGELAEEDDIVAESINYPPIEALIAAANGWYGAPSVAGKKVNGTLDQEDFTNIVVVIPGSLKIGEKSLNYYIEQFEELNEIFKINNNILLVMRGQYCDPSYFNEEKIQMSNVFTIPDYSVVKTSSSTTLCVGGSLSDDYNWRKKHEELINAHRLKSGKPYKHIVWDEGFKYDKDMVHEILSEHKIDSVITNNSYVLSKLFNSSAWCQHDDSINKEIAKDRAGVDILHKQITDNKSIHLKWWLNPINGNNLHKFNGSFVDIQVSNRHVALEDINNISEKYTPKPEPDKKKKKTFKSIFEGINLKHPSVTLSTLDDYGVTIDGRRDEVANYAINPNDYYHIEDVDEWPAFRVNNNTVNNARNIAINHQYENTNVATVTTADISAEAPF